MIIMSSNFVQKNKQQVLSDVYCPKLIMKTEITTNRGTQVLELEVGPANWAGELFKVHQERTMASLPADTVISTKRGTVGIKASVYPKSENKLPTKGLRISSARGTSTRTL